MEAVSIKDLTFEYPGSEKRVIDGLFLLVKEGEILCLCGETGCGKTTLLRNLKPVIAPHGKRRGEIFISGKRIDELDPREQASKIGFVMQDPDNQIVTDKVWHELAFGMENLGYGPELIRRRTAEIAGFFGIEGWYNRLTNQLSGGQKQILNLAAVMVMSPQILVLDEPTSRLDPVAAGDFLSALRKVNSELGTTIIISEHRLDDLLNMADRLAVMKDGKLIIDGTTADAISKISNAIKEPETNQQCSDTDRQWVLDMMPPVVRAYYTTSGITKDGDTKYTPLDIAQGRKWLSDVIEIKDIPSESKVKEDDLNLELSVKENSGGKASGRQGRSSVKDIENANKNAIELKKVWFRYSRDSEDVLKNLSLKIQKGSVMALTGGNGAGKSTLLSLISGSLRQYRGKVNVKGSISKLPQEPQLLFTEETVREELRSKSCSDEMAETFSIKELADKHPYDLSGGEQQKLALCEIFSQPADILLLDEPTKGLDARFRKILEQEIKKSKKTIVIISHDMEFCARCADKCSMIFGGEITVTDETRAFLSGNMFYTTQMNRMAGHIFPDVMLPEELAGKLAGRQAEKKKKAKLKGQGK